MRSEAEHGQAIVVFLVFLTVLLCFVAVVIDGGMYYVEKRNMQGAADAAALAAIREMPLNPALSLLRAKDYAESQNGDAGGKLLSYTPSDLNRSVTVRVGRTGTQNFGAIMGLDAPDISASATARVQMMGPRPGMLPMAFMRDSFVVGVNHEVKFDNNAVGNRGAIRAPIGAGCVGTQGSDDFRDTIYGSTYGGVDACPTALGGTVDTQPGNMSGPSRQGFDGRLTSNSQTFDDVFSFDASSGHHVVNDPKSPRIGIVPVVEHASGANVWPDGTSEPVRIISYMLVYIGKTDSPGNPAYTNNGRSVWVTPIRALLPKEFVDGEFIDYDATLPAPVVFRLVD